MQICYCEECGLRIPEADIASGVAERLGASAFRCCKCAAKRAPQKAPGKSTVHKAAVVVPASAAHASSKARIRALPEESGKPGRTMLYWSLGGAALAALGLVLILAGRGKPPAPLSSPSAGGIAVSAAPVAPAPKDEPKTPAKAERTGAEEAAPQGGLLSTLRQMGEARKEGAADDSSPREALAMRELLEVKRFAQEHPDDPWEYRERLADLVSRWRTTSAGKEAARLSEDLKLPAGPRTVKPLAHWKFDEGDGGATQDSAGSNPGSLKGQASRVAGKAGSGAVSLTGNPDDFADLGAAPALNFAAGAPFTIAGWAKTTANYGAIVSFRHSVQDGAVVDITVGYDGDGDSAGCLMALVRQDHVKGAGHAHVTGGQANNGAWRHFALTRNRQGAIRLYLDGALQGSTSGASSGGAITTDLRACGSERRWVQDNFNPVDRRGFCGQIDEVRVYGCALTEAEIKELAEGK